MHRPLTTTFSNTLCQRLSAWRYWSVFATLASLGVVALAIDLPLARLAHEHAWPKAVTEQLQRAEVFGYGVTVGVILVVVAVLDPARRSMMPRLVLMVFGAGLTADGVKLLLARIRPRDFDFQGNIWATFGRWLSLGAGGSKFHSFPSAHTATAVALAVALSAFYPRGRWMFGLFAVLVGCQRIVSDAHYASDVCWGAALGWFVAVGVGRASLGWLGFDRWEQTSAGDLALLEARG